MGYNFPNLESGKAVELLEVQFDPNIGFQGSLATSDPEGIGVAILNEQERVNIKKHFYPLGFKKIEVHMYIDPQQGKPAESPLHTRSETK